MNAKHKTPFLTALEEATDSLREAAHHARLAKCRSLACILDAAARAAEAIMIDVQKGVQHL